MKESIQENVDPAALSALKKVQESLDGVEETLKKWDISHSEAARRDFVWESRADEAVSYLRAVDELQVMVMGVLSAHINDRALVERGQDLLQVAMVRLKEEFRHMLVVHGEAVDSDWLLASASESSFSSNREDEEGNTSVTSDSSDDDDEEDIPIALPVTDLNLTLDLIPFERIRDLNNIAQRMVRSGYGKDCCQVYVGIRKTVLEQSLYRLGAEKLNVEDVKIMPWEILEVKIRKWIQALKVAIKVILASERKLNDEVFSHLSPWRETCFEELATGTMRQFLNFGNAIAKIRRTPEKLCKILDMYETLRDLLPEINKIFCDEVCESLRSEVAAILLQLQKTARGTLKEFENAIQRDPPKAPLRGCGFHPLTRYVMNYIRLLIYYSDTLKELLGDCKKGTSDLLGSAKDNAFGEARGLSPLAMQMISLIVMLETNLDGKSRLYKDPAQAYLFLMNNKNYIVQKVKQSPELAFLFGDDWFRKHTDQVRGYATSYVRTAWKQVLTCLREEGLTLGESLASGAVRVAIKDRFKSFNKSFEEALEVQSTWVVPDLQLRESLRMAIAEKLIPAYHTFIARFGSYLEIGRHSAKYIKYTPDELENCLIDLFDGTKP